jgi:amidase
MAFFSIGTDIGGSIRTPASFCGIYGHKATLDIVSMAGHFPGGLQTNPGFSTLLAVAGPMARAAEDLEPGLRILAGPESPDSKAFQWTLPQPRHHRLRDYRIGYLLEDSAVPVSTETKSVLEAAVRACEKAGATVKQGWPDGFQFQELLDTYFFLLGAFDFSVMPAERQQRVRPHFEKRSDNLAKGALSSFAEWQRKNGKRLAYRALWERFFESVDVFLLPTAFTTAFPHDPTPTDQRMIPMPEGGSQNFWSLLSYITPATLTGCPATTAPAGLSKSGLPVGLQIIGPYLEDATPIGFAQLLAREIGGFQPPPGYSNA